MGRSRKPKPDWEPTDPLPDARHERFALAYATTRSEKKSGKDCAIEAGFSDKQAPKAANRLLNRADVSERIRAILAAAAEASIMDMVTRKALLSNIARGDEHDEYEAIDKDGGKHNLKSKMLKTRISAVQELNKLDGAYAPDKHLLFGGAVFDFVVTDRKGKTVDLNKDGQ